MRTLTIAVLALLAAACRSLPEASADLAGFWQLDDSEQVVILAIGEGFAVQEEAPLALPYERYVGVDGGAPSAVQRGGFDLAGDQMVWAVAWDQLDPALSGGSYRWTLDKASRRRFVATDAAGESSTWRRIDALPESEPGLGSFGRFRWGAVASRDRPYLLRPTLDDGAAYYTSGNGETKGIRRLTPTGEQAYQLEGTGAVHHLIGDDHVSARAGVQTVLSRQKPDGSEVWATEGLTATAMDLAVREGEVWALFSNYGSLPEAFGLGPVPTQINYAIARFDAESGEILGAQWLGGGSAAPEHGRLLLLADGAFAVLTALQGEVEGPEGIVGRPDTDGVVVEVREADGDLRWRRWLGPDARFYPRTFALGPDGQIVIAGGLSGRLNLGNGLFDADPIIGDSFAGLVNIAFALDREDGALRWERLTEDADDYGLVRVATREDGRMAWVQSVRVPTDIGANVGTLTPTDGDALVVGLLDACGELEHAEVFLECECTYESASGFIQPWEAEFSPSGHLLLGLYFYGYYRFGGAAPGGSGTGFGDVGTIGEGRSGIVSLDGPGPAESATCPRPNLPVPKLVLEIEGSGEVLAGGLGECEADCELPGSLFERVELVAEPAPGWRFTGWTGACEGLDACVTYLDATVNRVGATFERTAITGAWALSGASNLAIVSPSLAVSPSGDALLGARVQGQLDVGGTTVITDTAGLPGLVVSVRPDGSVRWTYRLDPPGQGGTTPVGLLGRADGGADVLGSNGVLTRLGPTGAVVATGAVTGLVDAAALAVDDAGQLAVAGAGPRQAAFIGVSPGGSPAWTVQATTNGGVTLNDFVGLADGFVALLSWTGQLSVGDITLPGNGGYALVHLGGDGALLGAVALPAGAPTGLYAQTRGILQRGPDGGLWLLGDRTRDTAAADDSAYAEPIDPSGALRGSSLRARLIGGSSPFGAPLLRPLASDWAVFTETWGGEIEGFELPSRGDQDAVLGRISASAVRGAESFGSTGGDYWHATASLGDGAVGLLYFAGPATVGGLAAEGGYVLVRAEP